MGGREAIALAASFAGLCLMGFVALGSLGGRRSLRRPLPPQRFRAVTWDGEVCIWSFLLLIVSQAVIYMTVGAEHHELKLALISGSLVVELPIVLWLLGGLPYRPAFSWRKVREDAAVGFLAWLIVTPLALALFLASQYFVRQSGDEPQEHSLITLLRAQPTMRRWLLVALQAVIAAPICEELFFRGILQPWAMKKPWGGDLLFALAMVAGYLFRKAPTLTTQLMPSLFVAVLLVAYLFARRRVPPMPAPRGWHAPGGVIIGGGLLFAMMHGGAWPAPVPLALLGVTLGWLAYRTQGLVAPLVCHVLFNALTIISQFILLRPTA